MHVAEMDTNGLGSQELESVTELKTALSLLLPVFDIRQCTLWIN